MSEQESQEATNLLSSLGYERGIIFWLDPIGKPRQTQSDKWKKRPAVMKYRAFADELRLMASKVNWDIPAQLSIVFLMPFTKTILKSKKKTEAMLLSPHIVKPDLDNMVKAVQDVMAKNDSHIWSYQDIRKIWYYRGAVVILDPSSKIE